MPRPYGAKSITAKWLSCIERKEGKSFIAGYMIEEWEKIGINVCYLKAGVDFPLDAGYVTATTFDGLCHTGTAGNPAIYLIEYPAIQYHALPVGLLSKSDVNLLVINACRVWKNSDDKLLQHLKEISGETPILIFLNNSSRENVEDFTGPLPPYSSQHSVATQMMHMGFTAKGTAVKE